MIPSPPLEDGALLLTSSAVLEALRPGILAACCVCKRSSVWHWLDDGQRYHPLHNTVHCVDALFAEWYAMIAAGEVRPVGAIQLTGAYARRASVTQLAPVKLGSRDLGSPYFRPGMPEGTPWTAVTRLADGREVISPCGPNRAHAYATGAHWRALGRRGAMSGLGDFLPTAGWVVDPTGARCDEWEY